MAAHNHQLTHALETVSAGAAALRYTALANGCHAGVPLEPDFVYRALIGPLTELEGLVGDEPPPPRPRARRQRPPRAKRQARRAPTAHRPASIPEPAADLQDFDDRVEAWDPEEERPYSPLAEPVSEAASCRALLLEVIRRAAYDWVLYRTSSKLQNKVLAESAFIWLFQEDRGTALWVLRERGGKTLTAFVVICEMLDLDPEKVRKRIRQLTERDIMGAGRPAERRKPKQNEDAMSADEHNVFDVDISALPSFDPMFATGG